MDRREHISRSQGDRLRNRRYPVHARIRQSGGQVRRPERAVRRAREVRRIPARDVYGVRVADSATWKSLGKSGDITRAQHCRAEFHHPNFGWIPVDPADVRKVILEEDKDRLLPLSDPRVALARKTLFGA